MSDDKKVVAMPGCKVHANGATIPQAFYDLFNGFADEMTDLISRMSDAGMPAQLVLGMLECQKADVLDSMMVSIMLDEGD